MYCRLVFTTLMFSILLPEPAKQDLKCGRPLGSEIISQSDRIVAGYDLGYYRYPWYAALIQNKQVSCGGALIGPRMILTAAHCYKEYLQLANKSELKLEHIYTVRLGMYNICTNEKTVTEYKVEKVQVHELYSSKKPYFDVCLLTLANSTDDYEPLCLPAGILKKRPNEGTVPGMGTLKYQGAMPCTLHEARLLIYPNSVCTKMINETGNNGSAVENAFCAGYLAGGIDTCQGDSGGPLQILGENGKYVLLGYNGACRREEITNMSVDDIEFRDDILIVHVPKTKNYITRQFMITNSDWVQMVKKYFSLRPNHVTSRRFFLTYRNGYCINSPIGLKTIGKAPFVIASYLQLPNPELFTGHCFRRSSVTHLANSGGDLNTIKKHGGWKSSAVAEGYIETSMKSKVAVANILSTIQTLQNVSSPCLSSTSHNTTTTASVTSSETSRLAINEQGLTQNIVSTQNIPEITINATEHSTVTVNIYNSPTSS